jgi:hypothetical protein
VAWLAAFDQVLGGRFRNLGVDCGFANREQLEQPPRVGALDALASGVGLLGILILRAILGSLGLQAVLGRLLLEQPGDRRQSVPSGRRRGVGIILPDDCGVGAGVARWLGLPAAPRVSRQVAGAAARKDHSSCWMRGTAYRAARPLLGKKNREWLQKRPSRPAPAGYRSYGGVLPSNRLERLIPLGIARLCPSHDDRRPER